MRILTIAVLAAAACTPSIALAQDASPPDQGGPGRGPGMRLPATRAEAIARADERFARLDRNGDGFLSSDEMPVRPGGGPAGGQLARLDADGDGKLSKAEFQQSAVAMFDRMDADHDGTISPAERDAWRARMMPPPRAID
jgi:hypothetical protein